MTAIYDDEFRVVFYGEATEFIVIFPEGSIDREIELYSGNIGNYFPSSRWSKNKLLVPEGDDKNFARFVENAFNSEGGLVYPAASFVLAPPRGTVETWLEKDINIDDGRDEFSCEHDFGFENPGLFELMPEILTIPECLVFTEVEQLSFNFCCAGRGSFDSSKLSYDPVTKFPLYNGKADEGGDIIERDSSFRFFRNGVEQDVSYSFADPPLTAEQKEQEKREEAEWQEKKKRFMENYYDPNNPDPFQMLDMILQEIKDKSNS